MIANTAASRFRRLGSLTLFAVYFVILVGGIVRATGAGMGCPDWPTCFGQWVPPTAESQLPPNYQDIYAERGYKNTAFNPVKTWTEYVNRLVGVSVGILIMLTAWSSRVYLNQDKPIFFLSITLFLLVGFQGWLGSAVVASNLQPYMITLHMLMALFIVALLIYIIARSQKPLLEQINITGLHSKYTLVLKIVMLLTLVQIAMGTQVREAVDLIAHQHKYIERQFWRDSFPLIFYVHRSFSSLILCCNLWLGWQTLKIKPGAPLLLRSSITLNIATIIAIIAGVVLDRLAMPPIAQPIHLLIANIIFGLQFFLFICATYAIKAAACSPHEKVTQ